MVWVYTGGGVSTTPGGPAPLPWCTWGHAGLQALSCHILLLQVLSHRPLSFGVSPCHRISLVPQGQWSMVCIVARLPLASSLPGIFITVLIDVVVSGKPIRTHCFHVCVDHLRQFRALFLPYFYSLCIGWSFQLWYYSSTWLYYTPQVVWETPSAE